jgi:hypothetical protein
VDWRGGWGRLGWAPGKDSKWEWIFEFQMNLKFGKTSRNFARRFTRNWDKRIFLNSFRLLKDY